jgi:hypothetical protein
MGMANTAGNTKKSFQAAAIFVFYTVGNISGPFWVKTVRLSDPYGRGRVPIIQSCLLICMQETVGQHYPELWEGIIGSYALVIVLAIVLFVLLRRENQRRDRLHLEEKEAERVAFDDLTDKENLHFRYVY